MQQLTLELTKERETSRKFSRSSYIGDETAVAMAENENLKKKIRVLENKMSETKSVAEFEKLENRIKELER